MLRTTRRSRRSLGILVIGAVVVLVAFTIHTKRSTTPAPFAGPDATAVLATSTGSADDRRSPVDSTTDRPTAALSVDLRHAFATAPDLYAFAMDARKRPAEGGIFYAMQAANYCSWADAQRSAMLEEGLAQQIERTSTVSSASKETVERYLRRCAGFASGGSATLYNDLALESASGTDPLAKTLAALSKAKTDGDREASVRLLKTLLDYHDPLLLSHRWIYLANPDRVGQETPGGLWFEDRDYRTTADDTSLFQQALEIANCLPGSPCASDALRVLTCAYQALCATTVDAAYFEDTREGPRSPQNDARMRALIDRMRAAIARSDVDAFRSPARR